jgi:hypothetical protein
VTTEERLIEVRDMLKACSASITKVLGKTNQSVSHGGQSYTLANINQLMEVREKLREEERSLESALVGGIKRRTIKIHFPSC